MQNNVNSNISWYEGHIITSLGKILTFSKCYVQNIWQVVRLWHHQLTICIIILMFPENLSRKFAKLQSVIPSLYFNRFSSSFTVLFESFTLSSEIKLNRFRISPLQNKWKTQWKPKWWATVNSIEIFTTCSRLHRLVGRSQTCLPPFMGRSSPLEE